MDKTFVIAEVGINHNGDIEIAKKLIDGAIEAGCDAIKFQKRTVAVVYSQSDLDKYRESPWGTTNRAQKEGLEFGEKEYDYISAYLMGTGLKWFASAWDIRSQEFLRGYDLPYNKLASAMITHKELVNMVAEEGKYTFISTGMSTVDQIRRVIDVFVDANCPYELMHCNSTYPMKDSDVNLRVIQRLRETFGCKVGYSGHEVGIIASCAAVALGATSIERHITLDRSMYGSDQSASLEIAGLKKMVAYIRGIEEALGSSEKVVTEKEKEIAAKLRRVDTL